MRMLRLVAPSALRRPISRVRSVTVTSMMLMMPTAPRASVTMPTPPRKTSIAVKMTPTVRWDLMVSHSSKASLSDGIEAVALGDDAVDVGLGGLVHVGREGLVLDGGDGVGGDVFAVQREELQHGGEGDVDLLVVAVVVAAADALGDADDQEAVSVEGDVGAERGASGKEELVVLLAEDDDLAVLRDVLLVEVSGPRRGADCESGGSWSRRPGWGRRRWRTR